MRATNLMLTPLVLALAAPPAVPAAQAQISATIHIGAPLYRAPRYRRPPAVVVVAPRPLRAWGHWQNSARHWRPITLYSRGSRYYNRPYRNAKPVVVYSYKGHYFRAPKGKAWQRYRRGHGR